MSLCSSSLCFFHAWFLWVPFLRSWLQPFPLCFLLLVSLSLPLPGGSILHFLSIRWVLRSLPLPLLFLPLSSLLRVLLPFLSRVMCSWVLLLLGVCVRGRCPPLWGSLLGVCLSCLCPLCVLSSSSRFGGGWLWCLLRFHLWSLLLVVCSFRLFIPFVMFVSIFWFLSLSVGG